MKRWYGLLTLIIFISSAAAVAVMSPFSFSQKRIPSIGIILRGNANYDLTLDEEGKITATEFPMGNIQPSEENEGIFWVQNRGSAMMLTIELSEPNWDALDDDVVLRWEFPDAAVLIPANSVVELKLWVTITRSLPNAFDGSRNFQFLIVFNGDLT